ncbi:MAG: hypothetical protein ACE5LB_11200 [Acidiferrobacterales bacterium]
MDETIRQWVLFIVHWTIFLGFSLTFLLGAVFNGSIAWREWYKNVSDGPSIAPLLFGAIGIVAVLAAPFGDLADRLPYLWIPLVLDFGSAPYFSLVAYEVFKEKRRQRSEH